MALSDFIGPFIIALIIHALVLSSDMFSHDAPTIQKKGVSSITLNIVTSVASSALQSLPKDDAPDNQQRPARTRTQKEPSRAVPGPPQIFDANLPSRADRDAPEETSTQKREQETDQREQITPVADIDDNVEASPFMIEGPLLTDAGDDMDTGNNYVDVPEQGERIPASIVGLVKPVYPRFSRIHGEEGTVVLLVEVLADGSPGKIEIVSSSGYRRLDKAAIKAVGSARFIAGRINGREVDSTQRIAFRFNLHD
ncbi:MAG TPA: energy transducer TonB [Deltaproteobacteria bacterium]|nr:energy transducer TonB [Deltaproteobacteria bacterium]HPJ93288.1 energy transducer TonB [Deltaproteobacteria bacterium]HPR51593.1 energy transducer TonB [Deltaproteobacteria bacterium]